MSCTREQQKRVPTCHLRASIYFHRTDFRKLEGLYIDNDNVEDENRATGTDGNFCSTVPNGLAGGPVFVINEGLTALCETCSKCF